jgi:hypothetical protein
LDISCKCQKTNEWPNQSGQESGSIKYWSLCKCDLDISDIDTFFYKLGLPMYIDMYREELFNSIDLSSSTCFKHLIKLNETNCLRDILHIKNDLHYLYIDQALGMIKKLIQSKILL